MSPDFEIDIAIEDARWNENLLPLAQGALRAALAGSGRALAGPAELSVLLTNDAEQQELNRQWRGKDASTNVLSFPQVEGQGAVFGLLGDISLAYETVSREAVEQDKTFEAHFAHLLVHGMLHILGFDHESVKEALAMEARETDIMAQLGYPDPYGGEAPED